MEKIKCLVWVSLALTLSACNLFGPTRPDDTCADKAVYKKYNITMPARPQLNVETLTQGSNQGQAVRAYELDLTNLVEYSIKLENILAPIVADNAPDTTPLTENATPTEAVEEHWWNRLFSNTEPHK